MECKLRSSLSRGRPKVWWIVARDRDSLEENFEGPQDSKMEKSAECGNDNWNKITKNQDK